MADYGFDPLSVLPPQYSGDVFNDEYRAAGGLNARDVYGAVQQYYNPPQQQQPVEMEQPLDTRVPLDQFVDLPTFQQTAPNLSPVDAYDMYRDVILPHQLDAMGMSAADKQASIESFKANTPRPEETSWYRRALGDTGLGIAKGIVDIPAEIVGLGDLVSGGLAGRLAEGLGIDFNAAQKYLDSYMSPEEQAAEKRVAAVKGFFPTIEALIRNPSQIVQGIARSAPSILAGGAVARGARAALPFLEPWQAGALGEGVVSAGQNAEQVRSEDPTGSLSAGQSALLAGSGLLTGGISALTGGLANRYGIADINTLLAGGRRAGTQTAEELAANQAVAGANRLARGQAPATPPGAFMRTAGGFGEEGVSESLQSAQEQIAQNLAQGKPWNEGVSEAAAQGVLVGGVMGGGTNLFSGGHAAATEQPPALGAGETTPGGPTGPNANESTFGANSAAAIAARQAAIPANESTPEQDRAALRETLVGAGVRAALQEVGVTVKDNQYQKELAPVDQVAEGGDHVAAIDEAIASLQGRTGKQAAATVQGLQDIRDRLVAEQVLAQTKATLAGTPAAAAPVPPHVAAAQAFLDAVDKGGVPLNPAKIRQIAETFGLDVPTSAKPEVTIGRIRQAVARATPAPATSPIQDTIRNTVGIRTGSDRAQARDAWMAHFDTLDAIQNATQAAAAHANMDAERAAMLQQQAQQQAAATGTAPQPISQRVVSESTTRTDNALKALPQRNQTAIRQRANQILQDTVNAANQRANQRGNAGNPRTQLGTPAGLDLAGGRAGSGGLTVEGGAGGSGGGGAIPGLGAGRRGLGGLGTRQRAAVTAAAAIPGTATGTGSTIADKLIQDVLDGRANPDTLGLLIIAGQITQEIAADIRARAGGAAPATPPKPQNNLKKQAQAQAKAEAKAQADAKAAAEAHAQFIKEQADAAAKAAQQAEIEQKRQADEAAKAQQAEVDRRKQQAAAVPTPGSLGNALLSATAGVPSTVGTGGPTSAAGPAGSQRAGAGQEVAASGGVGGTNAFVRGGAGNLRSGNADVDAGPNSVGGVAADPERVKMVRRRVAELMIQEGYTREEATILAESEYDELWAPPVADTATPAPVPAETAPKPNLLKRLGFSRVPRQLSSTSLSQEMRTAIEQHGHDPLLATNAVLDVMAAQATTRLQRKIIERIRRLNIRVPITFTTFTDGKTKGAHIHTDATGESRIQIDETRGNDHTVLHELVHAATIEKLDNPTTDADRAAIKQLNDLFEEAKRQLLHLSGMHAFTNVREFVAEAFSNPELQEELDKIKLPGHPSISLLSSFKYWVQKLLGVDSLLGQTMLATDDLFAPMAFGRPMVAGSAGVAGPGDEIRKHKERGRIFKQVLKIRDELQAQGKLPLGTRFDNNFLSAGQRQEGFRNNVLGAFTLADGRNALVAFDNLINEAKAVGRLTPHEFFAQNPPTQTDSHADDVTPIQTPEEQAEEHRADGAAFAGRPKESMVGTDPATGERKAIAYLRSNGKYDYYEASHDTAQTMQGIDSTKTPGLTRQQVEQMMQDAKLQFVPPYADSQQHTSEPPSADSKFIPGYDGDNYKFAAFQQEDGSWNVYESQTDNVSTDVNATKTNVRNKAAVQARMNAGGYRTTAPAASARVATGGGGGSNTTNDTGSATLTPGGPAKDLLLPATSKKRVAFVNRFAALQTFNRALNEHFAKYNKLVPDWAQIAWHATVRNSRAAQKIEDFTRKHIEPIMATGRAMIKKYGKTSVQIENDLVNLHFEERADAKEHSLDPDTDWASGKAKDFLDDLARKKQIARDANEALKKDEPAYWADLERLALQLKEMSNSTIDLAVGYGLLRQDVGDRIKNTYKYYVPIQNGPRTVLAKTATGTSAEGTTPFQRMQEQMLHTIMRGEQNGIRQRVFNIASKLGVNIVNADGKRVFEFTQPATAKIKVDPRDFTVGISDDSVSPLDPHAVAVFFDGKRQYMRINDEQMFEALKMFSGVDKQTGVTSVIGAMSYLNGIAAMGKTAANPGFALFNLIRDAGITTVQLPREYSRGKFLQHLASPKVIGSSFVNAFREAFGKEVKGLYKQAKEAGGLITQQAYAGLDPVNAAVQGSFNPSTGSKLKRAFRYPQQTTVAKVLTSLSQALESTTRLAIYNTVMDKHLAEGMSHEAATLRAGVVAKTTTVNFEQRGTVPLGPLYMFANAKVQGLATYLDKLTAEARELKGLSTTDKLKALPEKYVMMATGGMIGLGLLAAMLGYKDSDKDKDGTSKYGKIPQNKRDTMFIAHSGAPGFPLPQELAPFYALGNTIGDMIWGDTQSYANQWGPRMLRVSMQAFSPINTPQQDIAGYKSNLADYMMRMVTPSVFLPVYDISTNKNTFGSEIVANKDKNQATGMPLREMYSKNENTLAVNAAKAIYNMTGADWAPAQLKYVATAFDPTAASFWSDMLGFRYGGEKPTGNVTEDLSNSFGNYRQPSYPGQYPSGPLSPLLRRFDTSPTSFADDDNYNLAKQETLEAKYFATNPQSLRRGGTVEADTRKIAALQGIFAQADKDISALYKNFKQRPQGSDLAINTAKQTIQQQALKHYYAITGRGG